VGPFLLNLMYLRAPARRVTRQLKAELPEFVAILSAEVAAETTLQEAVIRLARGAGTCAKWFQFVVQSAAGKSLFTEAGVPGALLEEARKTGERDLISLARTLDNIKRRGTGTKELLTQLARDTASRFTGEAQLRAEKIGSEIILPMILFFFLPYVLVILSVLAGPLLAGGIF
jgi:Flp pilus assembly protein TadB